MRICRRVSEMQAVSKAVRRGGATLGLVPTMGALHAGHMSLIRAAREQCDVVTASIFVNPTQFAAGEDFESYPRVFDEDCAKLDAEDVEILFAPDASEMYPAGATTFVEVGGIGDRLDGASRPGHFRGVATIVAKLFNIVGPDRAYFGQKDAAQVAVLRAMVRDLNFPLELVVCPTVREDDGLALSSRNRFLSVDERQAALVLRRSLCRALRHLESSEMAANHLRETMHSVVAAEPLARLDYAEIVDPNTLLPVNQATEDALFAVAAWIGKTRLIDNLLLKVVEHE